MLFNHHFLISIFFWGKVNNLTFMYNSLCKTSTLAVYNQHFCICTFFNKTGNRKCTAVHLFHIFLWFNRYFLSPLSVSIICLINQHNVTVKSQTMYSLFFSWFYFYCCKRRFHATLSRDLLDHFFSFKTQTETEKPLSQKTRLRLISLILKRRDQDWRVLVSGYETNTKTEKS